MVLQKLNSTRLGSLGPDVVGKSIAGLRRYTIGPGFKDAIFGSGA